MEERVHYVTGHFSSDMLFVTSFLSCPWFFSRFIAWVTVSLEDFDIFVEEM